MDALELFRLARRLAKLAESAIPESGFHGLAPRVRMVMLDVFDHPDTSVREITERTGFPQSHVSASVAKLRGAGVFVTTVDPTDRRRTRVRQSPGIPDRAARVASVPINEVLAAAMGTEGPGEVADVVAALERVARRLSPRSDQPAEGASAGTGITTGEAPGPRMTR